MNYNVWLNRFSFLARQTVIELEKQTSSSRQEILRLKEELNSATLRLDEARDSLEALKLENGNLKKKNDQHRHELEEVCCFFLSFLVYFYHLYILYIHFFFC